MVRRVLVWPCLVSLAACAGGAGSRREGAGLAESGDARAAIEAANARLSAAFSRSDAARMASFYTQDAELVGYPEVRGRPAVEAFFRAMTEALQPSDVSIRTTEVEQHGDTAWEAGEVRWTMHRGPTPGPQARRYVVIWKRGQDGAWRIHRDILSEPAPAAPAR